MSSKKRRQTLRKYSHPLNILEGKDVQFTSGPWEGSTVHLANRNKKGNWRILTFSDWHNGWYEDKINDEQLFEYSNEVRILLRDIRLSNLLNQS